MLMFPSLTPTICMDLQELANPSGKGRLPPQQLQEAVSALKVAQIRAQSIAKQSPRTTALDYLALEQSFTAALELLELMHPAP